MARYEIHGGKPLNGTVTISGAKNAAVAILPAALLVSGKCRIENVPCISAQAIYRVRGMQWVQGSRPVRGAIRMQQFCTLTQKPLNFKGFSCF